jgi:sensor histidine kinase regulating citrate/malate metabolism
MLFGYVMQYFFQVYGIDRLWISRPPLIVCCIFGLSLQFGLLAYKKELEEKDRLEDFLRQANRQYEMNRANIELINMKAHDLKHFIGRVKELSGSAEELTEMENAVHQYEKTVACGNKALDALLTDKQYQCIAAGIDLTLMVDGAELNFMRTADIVSLFSNAMDNAIECELSVDDPARRSISLKVDRRGSFVCVHAENYCEQAPLIRDGLPVTSKADPNFHGFGVKSIRYVAEKYGGSMSVGVREHTFVLNVLLPIP